MHMLQECMDQISIHNSQIKESYTQEAEVTPGVGPGMALGGKWEWGLHKGEFVGSRATGTKAWKIKPRKGLIAERALGKDLKPCE